MPRMNLKAFDLSGRTALVTGAGVGLGRAIALSLADAGAAVGVHYNSSREGADEAVREIIGKGGRAFAIQGDLTSETAANALVDRVVAEGNGRLDILVNNAGA